MTVCSQCGVEAEASGAAPLGWMVERDRNGLVVATCAACTRRHARAIEGKLDTAWW